MRKTLIGIGLVALLAGSGCGNGDDGLSEVVGPNPLSDARSVWKALSDNGWSDEHIAELRGFISGSGYEHEDADCIAGEIADRFSASEFANSTGTDKDVRKLVAAFADCGFDIDI